MSRSFPQMLGIPMVAQELVLEPGLSIVSGVLLIRAPRRTTSNIHLSTGCPRRLYPRPRPRTRFSSTIALSPPSPPRSYIHGHAAITTIAPRRCPNCAIRTEIESAIFRVMSNRRLLFLTSSTASLLISFQPPHPPRSIRLRGIPFRWGTRAFVPSFLCLLHLLAMIS